MPLHRFGMTSRRNFLAGLLGAAAASPLLPRITDGSESELLQRGENSINRRALVRRHNPVLSSIDPLSPLSLGNGEFAFTADVTGLQTLVAEHENAMPLCTMSQWGWHSKPKPSHLIGKELRLKEYETYGRKVGYQTSSEGQTELFNWLRENPHKLNLIQLSFCRTDRDQRTIRGSELHEIRQELDLFRGVLSSSFSLEGSKVLVTTAVHPQLDLLAVKIESNLLSDGRLGVRIAFPYGSPGMQASDWTQPDKHQTSISIETNRRVDFSRTLDTDTYNVAIAWEGSGKFTPVQKHVWTLQSNSNLLVFSAALSQKKIQAVPPASQVFLESEVHWTRFWTTGGAIELADTKNPKAFELERRIVLSQYLTAIQCSGRIPPQETGLTTNSWYGKFHLEMHWWHAAHFAMWNRLPLLERSLSWYDSILPGAKRLAQSQGYAGARWPKMVGPEGRDSPSPIGPLLIWQQPHPIFYAELCYQSHPNRKTLTRYQQIVFESAAFMASYAYFDKKNDRFVLGPPVIPAQENHPPAETWNPTFELEYWHFGLEVAQQWRERMGLKRIAEWDRVLNKLSPLPIKDEVYLAHENCPQTYTERNHDHPSMLGALGILPGVKADQEVMRRTLNKTMKEWTWADTWGWDYPMTAMTAARLGETKTAIDSLLMQTEKNRYLPNGHNWQRANLPCYLPGNGGLLYAVSLMAAGWKGCPNKHAPGFPDDWKVKHEGLNEALVKKF